MTLISTFAKLFSFDILKISCNNNYVNNNYVMSYLILHSFYDYHSFVRTIVHEEIHRSLHYHIDLFL